MPKEIEIKFRVSDARELTRLRAAQFRQVTPRNASKATHFSTFPAKSCGNVANYCVCAEYGTGWLLTHKARSKITRHKTRVEIQTEIADGKQLEKILLALGYVPSFRYEKFRAEWSDGKGQVVLDETPIGSFGEIEGPARWIDRTARKLGIDRQSYITDSYAELFFAWKRQTRNSANEMTFRAVRDSTR